MLDEEGGCVRVSLSVPEQVLVSAGWNGEAGEGLRMLSLMPSDCSDCLLMWSENGSVCASLSVPEQVLVPVSADWNDERLHVPSLMPSDCSL
jgi:hypothetical protein